jgi:hypothetical protein
VVVVHDALQSFAKCLAAKVHEQAKRLLGKAEVGEQLLAVNGQEAIGRFYFDDQATLDEQIGAARIAEEDSIKLEFDRLLPIDSETAAPETGSQNRFIDGLEQARTEILVDPDPAIDGDGREILDVPHLPPLRLRAFA